MSLQAVPLWIPLQTDGVTQVQHPAELVRSLQRAMSTRAGVIRPGAAQTTANVNSGDFATTVVPAAMQLTIAAGAAFVVGRENAAQIAGMYYAYSEASEVISWPANASGSTRMDSLILRIADPQYGSIGGNPLGAWWDAVAGSSGSARPDSDFLLAGSKYIPGAWLRICDISVPNAATQLTQVNISFKGGYADTLGYHPYFLANTFGGGVSYGQEGFELDTGQATKWTGAAFTAVNSPLWKVARTTATVAAVGETIVLTSPAATYQPFTAYRLHYQSWYQATGGTGMCFFVVRDTNVAGTQRYGSGQFEIPVLNRQDRAEWTGYVMNNTASPITGRVLVATIASASASTVLVPAGGAGTPAYFECYEAGRSTDHPDAIAL